MVKRGEGRYKLTHGVRAHFDYYEEVEGGLLTRKKYELVLRDICQSILDDILLKGYDFKIPGIGYIEIRKRKVNIKTDEDGNVVTKGLRTDYKATKDLWAKKYPGLTMDEIVERYPDRPRVFHLNKHNGGYDVKVGFNINNFRFRNRQYYSFVSSRLFKRGLKDAINNGIEIYEV